jgi:ubiquinone/menaquinone biosynthesis C-methylase UbiE
MARNQSNLPGSGGFLNPQAVLEHIGISEGIKVGDFGCGHGYFAILLGKMVGVGGRVYAVDVMPEALEAVRSRAALEGVHNIETVKANLETLGATKILKESLDLVIISNVLFQTKEKAGVLLEAGRVLKNGGRAALIDWDPASSVAPGGTFLLSAQEARGIAEDSGLVFEKDFGAGQHHWGIIVKK